MLTVRRTKTLAGVRAGSAARGHTAVAVICCFAGFLLLAPPGHAVAVADSAPGAQRPPPEEPTPATAPAAAPAAAPVEGGAAEPQAAAAAGLKIAVNGYLTQAYARSDGNQILGIPQGGTADYRTAAVQLRVGLTKEDSFSIQVGNDRLGDSPVQAFTPELGLDWLFYEHRFGAGAVKVGRVKIPFGIYNEVRDVGTLLPFFRPSSDFYGTGSFTTETVDGAAVSYSFGLGGGWQLDADAYGGNWEYLSISSEVGLAPSKARGTLGGELWLSTPVPGLRVGAGGMRYTALTPGVPKTAANTSHVSLEWDAGRVVAHVEYKIRREADARTGAGYAHLGFHLTDRLAVNGQVEYDNLRIKELPLGTIHLDRDLALGASYAFRHDLVLKLEHHWNKGFELDPQADLFAPPRQTRYAIASLSVSF